MSRINKAFRKFLILFLDGFRPLLGNKGCCRFTVDCSSYAKTQLEQEPLFRAFWNIIKRLLSCHPFHKFN